MYALSFECTVQTQLHSADPERVSISVVCEHILSTMLRIHAQHTQQNTHCHSALHELSSNCSVCTFTIKVAYTVLNA
jgi:hypothetical protein